MSTEQGEWIDGFQIGQEGGWVHYSIESDSAFLKNPLAVNDIFLKTYPSIDALRMILIDVLMVGE
jgi:hypothetical protein